jgi:hypothetical protein
VDPVAVEHDHLDRLEANGFQQSSSRFGDPKLFKKLHRQLRLIRHIRSLHLPKFQEAFVWMNRLRDAKFPPQLFDYAAVFDQLLHHLGSGNFDDQIVLSEQAPSPGCLFLQRCDQVGNELLFKSLKLSFCFLTARRSAHDARTPSSEVAYFGNPQ